MRDYREAAYALLRVTVGVMFFFYGVGKLLRGLDGFVSGMQESFAESPLPGWMVTVFAHVLPFAEIGIGALLVLGLFNLVALVLAALLMLALTFGKVMEPDPAGVARNVNYALVIFVLLFLAGHNGYSVDRLLGRGPGAHD